MRPLKLSVWKFEVKDGTYTVVCSMDGFGYILTLYKKRFLFLRELVYEVHHSTVGNASYSLMRYMDYFNDLALKGKSFNIESLLRSSYIKGTKYAIKNIVV